jgi:hypothetical protein
LLSSFSGTENEHLLFGFSTKIMSEKYSFECVKFIPRGFLRQVATGQFVDLTTLGIFFNLVTLKEKHLHAK